MIRADNDCPASVLIVDSTGETSEVLRTVLERKGLKIFATSEAREGRALLRQHHPQVTVLDVESQQVDECREYDSETGASLVILGKLPHGFGKTPRERVVAKPYHYAPLIRTIEELVEQSYAKAG